MTFSYQSRKETLARLKNEELDLLIVGGGITGAGVALQVVASGIKTGLVEMQDFAEGTSSRSTKLVHGGIRYLKTFDVGVVADTVQERAVIQRIAPTFPGRFRCCFQFMTTLIQPLICLALKLLWTFMIN